MLGSFFLIFTLSQFWAISILQVSLFATFRSHNAGLQKPTRKETLCQICCPPILLDGFQHDFFHLLQLPWGISLVRMLHFINVIGFSDQMPDELIPKKQLPGRYHNPLREVWSTTLLTTSTPAKWWLKVEDYFPFRMVCVKFLMSFGCNLKGFDLMLPLGTCGRAKWRKAWPSCFTAARTTWWIEIEMQLSD